MMRTVLRDVLSCDLHKIWSCVALRLQPGLRVAGFIGVFGTAALAASVSPVVAGFDQVETERVSASLFTTDVGVQPGTPTTIGLELEMDEGWHVYWRNPGDSGAPPTIQWTVPEGVEVGNIAWPLPERLPYGPLVNFGYEGTIVLTMPFTVPETAAIQQTIPVVADVTWLVCEEICIPEDAQFAFDVTVSPSGPVEDPIWSDVARTAAQSLPSPSPWNARFSANDNGFTLGISAPELSRGRITAAEFFPNDDGVIENAAPQLFGVGETGLAVRTNNGVDARTLDEPIAGLLVIEEEVGDGNTLRQGFIISAERGSAPVPGADALNATVAGMTLWYAILFALLGGIILNVMPCVFPVLSLKAMSLVKTASEDARAARISGLSYTAGILTCFMALAGVLLALKASGAAIGWGFQMQSPAVVMLLAFVLFLVGLNLSGVFELRLSSGGVGQSLAGRGGATGSYFTGMLAAIVATPCTAPFMAAAVGFAMTQSTVVALSVFFALGLGLALPYLLISFAPPLLKRLPKPGPWMTRVRQVLAFPMYGSVVWLVWVLSQQTGPNGVLFALVGLLALAFGAWLYEMTRESGRQWRAAGTVAAILCLLLTGGLARLTGEVQAAAGKNSATQESDDFLQSEPFSPDTLASLRKESRPVFINFTAAWCITCIVNEQATLRSDAVKRAMEDTGTVYLKGDWTNYDADITEMLEKYQRSGVPLYLYYSASGDVEVLPQILTETTLIETLRGAG